MRNVWSGRRDSNPRPRPWQGRALPLSYTRIREGNDGNRPSDLPMPKGLSLCNRRRISQCGVALRPSAFPPLPQPPQFRPMPATPDDLFAFLDQLGIPHPTVTHPPLFTVEQSRALRGPDSGRAHQEPVPERQEGRAVPGRGAGGRRDRAQGPASSASAAAGSHSARPICCARRWASSRARSRRLR